MTDEKRKSLLLGGGLFAYGSIIATAFAFLVYRRQNMIAPVVDLNGFGFIARNIVLGEGFSSGYGPTVRRGPLFPYLGAALIKLFGGDAATLPDAELYAPIVVANCLFIGGACLVVYHAGRRLFGERGGVVAALICPLFPQSIRYVGMTEVETLMSLFITAMALTSIAFATKPSAGSGAAVGLVSAGATLTKPIAMLFPLAFVPLALYLALRKGAAERKALLRAGVVALACFAVPLLPWMARNAVVTHGEFKGISSNAAGEFLRGYINAQPKYYLLQQDFGGNDPNAEKWDPEANAYEEALLNSHGAIYYRCGGPMGSYGCTPTPPPNLTAIDMDLTKDRIESAEMKRRVLANPAEFVKKFVVQLATFWYIVETRKKSMIIGFIALVMLSLSAIGLVRARREGVTAWPVAFVILYFNVIYAAFLAFARYSMPVYPTLAILAGGGLLTLYEKTVGRFFPGTAVRGRAPQDLAS